MENEKNTVRYRSSFLYMSMNLGWASLLIALVTLRLLPNALRTGDALVHSGLTVIALAACVLYFVLCRFVLVNVDEDEVVIRPSLRRGKKFSRAEYVFTSRFRTFSYKNIPLWTRRFLIADDGRQRTEVLLPNFTQRSFSLLMAGLREPSGVESTDVRAITAEFVFPKAKMLAEYRRFILLVLAAIFAVMAAQFFVLGSMTSKDSLAERLFIFGSAFCVLVLVFGTPMFLSYRGKIRRIPERVSIRNGVLSIDDITVQLADIRQITATPATYGIVAFGSAREITVETDWGRVQCNCGMRSSGRILKTVFGEYAELCQTLEQVAVASGLSLVYSL